MIAKGDLFADRDWRETERVVEVVSVTQDRVRTRVVTAPFKPWTVGRESLMTLRNLTRRYRPVKAEQERAAAGAAT